MTPGPRTEIILSERLGSDPEIHVWKQRRLLTALKTIDLDNDPCYVLKKEGEVGSIIFTCTLMASFVF